MALVEEEFFNHQAFEEYDDAARYAILFAQDCNPKNIYAPRRGDQPTNTFSALAMAVGEEVERRRVQHAAAGKMFYGAAFTEQAAQEYNENPDASFEDLLAAGQAESDSLAG